MTSYIKPNSFRRKDLFLFYKEKKRVRLLQQTCFVHTTGLEPARPFGHEPLKPARLPIPPCVPIFIPKVGYKKNF
jgi:hypothetical protein